MEGIKEKISHGLTINRMPYKSYKSFCDLAREEFCSDYGMTLVYLLKFHDGIITLPDEKVVERFEDLQRQIDELKEQKVEEKPKVRRSLSGDIIR